MRDTGRHGKDGGQRTGAIKKLDGGWRVDVTGNWSEKTGEVTNVRIPDE